MIVYDPHRTTPNWAPGAAEALAGMLKPTDFCFEWGGGQSTAWLSKLVPEGFVVTVEHDLTWLQRTVKLTKDCDNCQIIYAPCKNVDRGKEEPWMLRYVDALRCVHQPSVFLIDGYLRSACLDAALNTIDGTTRILLDDALDYVHWHDLSGFKKEVFRMPHPHKGLKNLWGRMSPDFKETWILSGHLP